MRLITKGVSRTATAILCTLLMLTVGGIAYITLEHLEWIRVPSASMVPTIPSNSTVLVWKSKHLNIERGDIVVFSKDNTNYIKRVVGMSSEHLQIIDENSYIDGVLLSEPYAVYGKSSSFAGDFYIPEDAYFVMGDNRDYSEDSRFWDDPYIEKDRIIGKMLLSCKLK